MEKNADRHNHHPEFTTATSAKFLNQNKTCIKENRKAWHWPTNIDISEIGLYNPLRGNNLEFH